MAVKIVVSLSGGLDSAVVLAEAVRKFGRKSVATVNFAYPSKHSAWEGRASVNLVAHFGVPCTRVDMSGLFAGLSSASGGTSSSLLVGGDSVPEGHYNEESMRSTVVPGRNLMFAAAVAAVAETYARRRTDRDQVLIGLGVHQGDHHIYPDCRPAFVAALRLVIQASTENLVEVWTPLLDADKKEVVAWGHKLNVPFGLTRTCYQNDAVACGKCGSCRERLEAFALNGLTDPLRYAPELQEVA